MEQHVEIKRTFDFLRHQLSQGPLEVSLASKVNDKWETMSTEAYCKTVNKVSQALLACGIKKGDKVAISSNNRTEWNLVDMGAAQIGAITVPVYPTVSAKTCAYILEHSEAKMCFVDHAEVYERTKLATKDIASLSTIYSFETIEGCTSFSNFLTLGAKIDEKEIEKHAATVTEDDVLTIIYTSGTTGTPKGVVLTHKNLVSNVLCSYERVPVNKGYRLLSFLPLSHIFERMVLYIYQFRCASIYYAESLETIARDAQDIKPHGMTVVPRLLEKVYDKIIDKGKALSGLKKALFFWAVNLGLKYEPYSRVGLRLNVARKLIFKKWQQALGGQIKFMVSGSAPLRTDLIRVFYAAGMPVIEGYGLTETSPVISVNQHKKEGFRVGSVGRAIKGVEVKLAADGEILVKGDNVMKGYYKNDEANKKVFDKDGYFLTGDVGELHDGFLKITDRKKELLKTSGGKFIAPQVLENTMKKSRFIEQVIVIGEGQKFPSAIIQPDFGYLEEWCKIKNLAFGTTKEMVGSQVICDRIMQEVEKANEEFGQWEKIKKIVLVADTWSVDTEELTPTMKVKRKVLYEKYADKIQAIYTS